MKVKDWVPFKQNESFTFILTCCDYSLFQLLTWKKSAMK